MCEPTFLSLKRLNMDENFLKTIATNISFAGVLALLIWRLPIIIATYNDGKKEIANIMGDKIKPISETTILLISTFKDSIKDLTEHSEKRFKNIEESLENLCKASQINQESLLKLLGK